ncbi:FtsX-like permease family protein [Ornithinimicrobium sp. Y1847]|uniref:FtsX-like permease family protein n=1 Tax=Ornithinimicrobium sp. Y1847 TaxID=3405419 RepID=UPI003B66C228
MQPQLLPVVFLGGAVLAALGAILVPPLLVSWLAALLIRLDRPTTVIAGRRLQAQPGALTRVLAGLIVGLFVATAAQGLVANIQGLPQYRAVVHEREVEAATPVWVPDGQDVGSVRERVEQLDGLREFALVTSAATPGVTADPGTGQFMDRTVLVTSCAELTVLLPRVQECSDGQAARVIDPWLEGGNDRPAQIEVRAMRDDNVEDSPPGELVDTVAVAGEPIVLTQPTGTPRDYDVVGSFFLPRGLLTAEQLDVLQDGRVTRALVVADPRPNLPGELRALGLDPASYWDVADFDRYQREIDSIRLLTAVVLTIGLAAFLLGMVDRVLERRVELSRLRLLGTPVGVLRGSHWLEVALPLLLGCGLALGLGHLVGAGYLDLANQGLSATERYGLPPFYLAGTLLAAAGGALLVAALTSLGLGSRLRPEQVRQA